MVAGVPERRPNTSVRFIDMNANGSTDIVWVDVSGSPAGHVTCSDARARADSQ
mgnify:CR=1 FL=1